MADRNFMTPEQIRIITNHFCRMTRMSINSAKELDGIAVGLVRHDDGWSLEAVRKPFNRRRFTTVIDLPEDIINEDLTDALIDLAGLISRKLAASSTIINSNLRRSAEVRRQSATKASVAAARARKNALN